MKVIRRSREFPFLLTVVALFVVALGHLGLQIWGNPQQRTPVSALEAPVKAPKISSPTIVPDPEPEPVADPQTDPVEDADDPNIDPETGDPIVPPATGTEPQKSPEEQVAVPTPQMPPKPAEPVKKAPPVVAPKPSVPAKAVAKPVAPAPDKQVVQVVKAEPLKPARKPARKKKVQVEPEVPEYVVPDEWNWFAKPMTMVHNGSEWVLTTETATAPEALTTIAPEIVREPVVEAPRAEPITEKAATEAIVAQPEPELSASAAVEDDSNKTSTRVHETSPVVGSSAGAAPVPAFERALAKMAVRRAKRMAEAERMAVKLPSQGGANDKVPGSLRKMIDVLGNISHEASAGMATDQIDSVPAASGVSATADAGEETEPSRGE